jgi:hypothetical protein
VSDKAFDGMLKIVKDKLLENNLTTVNNKWSETDCVPSWVGGLEDPCLP